MHRVHVKIDGMACPLDVLEAVAAIFGERDREGVAAVGLRVVHDGDAARAHLPRVDARVVIRQHRGLAIAPRLAIVIRMRRVDVPFLPVPEERLCACMGMNMSISIGCGECLALTHWQHQYRFSCTHVGWQRT